MLLVAVLALSLDLDTVQSEPDLVKRSEMALEYANTAMDQVRDAYREGRIEDSQQRMMRLEEAVTTSFEALIETGKDPRRDSKPFKKAEQLIRQLLLRLTGFKQTMFAVDEPTLVPVIENISDIHDRLVTGILTGSLPDPPER